MFFASILCQSHSKSGGFLWVQCQLDAVSIEGCPTQAQRQLLCPLALSTASWLMLASLGEPYPARLVVTKWSLARSLAWLMKIVDAEATMESTFSTLTAAILQAKGLSQAQLALLETAGVRSKADFATIGDAETLGQLLPDLTPVLANEIMTWALGTSLPTSLPNSVPNSLPTVVVTSPDAVHCAHCGSKQPHDYKSGDLCLNCGLQAEPLRSCHWCSASGPGKFCRNCGAEFVPPAELELALLLKREGQPKEEIPRRLHAMTAEAKTLLWGRIRRGR
jgi:hypothetical protein